MLWIPYAGSIVAILGLALLVVWQMREELKEKDSLIQNLLNRIQAADLAAYQRLQDSSKISKNSHPVAYVPQDDESEAKRRRDLAGVGEELYDDDPSIGAFAEAFGLDLGDGSIPGR